MKKFYILDNNVIYSSGLESMLRSINHEVFVNHGYHGSHHILKEIIISKPDIIIMDVVVPGMDGIALIHELQENPETNFMPIAVYTSYGNRSFMEKSFDKGADHFFIKEDFPPQILLNRLFKIYKKQSIIL